MTVHVFHMNRSQGTARPRVLTVPTPGPTPAQRLLRLNFNQGTGPMTDSVLGNNGVVAGGLERRVAGISTGSNFSAAGDGVSGTVQVAHDQRYQQRSDGSLINAFAVSFFAQRDTNPAVGQKMVMAAKDAGAPVGGFSIEAYNDGGTVKLRAYLKGTGGVVWIGSQTGVVALPVQTAARIVLTYDGTNAKLWVNDGAAKATAAVPGAGLSSNASNVQVFAYHNVAAPFDGIIDDFNVWDGALDQTAIEALDDPVTIDHGTPPPPVQEFSCVARSGATVITAHKNLGIVTSEQQLNDGGSVSYDCTGTQVNMTWSGPNDRNPTPFAGFRFYGDHNGACASGGAVFGNLDPAWRYGSIYPSGGAGVPVFCSQGGGANQTMLNTLVEGYRIHRTWDAIRNGNANPKPNFLIVRGVWASDIHDDSVEADNLRTFSVFDCLFDGVFSGLSFDNTGTVPNGTVVTVDKMLMRLRPMGAGGATEGPGLDPGHKEFVKCGRDGNTIPVDITNCVFALQQAANTPSGGGDAQGNPFRRLFVNGNLRTWQNNTICWFGAGAYPWTVNLPSGTTVLTGGAARTKWLNDRSAWIAAHPLVRRYGSPHDDGFAIP